jgi:DNA-binding LacI/PurR family transcriptional regulator/signal transduction histidine kinase
MKQGLLIQVDDPKMWQVVNGVLHSARKNGTNLMIHGCPEAALYGALDEVMLRRLFCMDPLVHEGLLFAFSGENLLDLAERQWKEGKPVLLLGRQRGEVPCVMVSFRRSFRDSVTLLAERGHTQIAFLGGPEGNQSSAEKLAGYLEGLEHSKIPVDPALILPGDYTEEGGDASMAAALSSGVVCTALLATNDLSAIGAMHALREAGLSAGADVEVLGFDNIPRARWTKPALTTYEPHFYQLGHLACWELARCARDRVQGARREVSATLIPRSTTWDATEAGSRRDELREIDRLEHRFLYQTQLAILRAESHPLMLLTRLAGARATPATFVETFRELLAETTRLGLSAGCLGSLLSFPPESEQEEQMLRHCHSLQNEVLLEEQKRRAETALRYNTAANLLRDPELVTAKEDSVVATLLWALGSLDIHKACIFLLDAPGPLNTAVPMQGQWIRTRNDGELDSQRVPAFTLDLMQEMCEADAWIQLPLVQGGEILGFMMLDAGTEFLPHYPDLARQFSMALQAGRMQRALAKANAELVETSRLAGLAEMATGVLHNIGNALNSVNTSTSLLADQLSKSRHGGVTRVAKLLAEHAADLGDFISRDPKGSQVPGYLAQLGTQLEAEHAATMEELQGLRGMIDHINQIVAAQQSYAQVSGIIEKTEPEEILEFALRLGEASLTRHGITVHRDYQETARISMQRQKTVQILVNLIRNAKESMDEARPPEKRLELGIQTAADGMISISIGDNGVGIDPANMARMFSFGFSTKPNGHGFGLHNSALAAREMNGRLEVRSEGLGKGARFILTLPSG